MDSRTSLRLQIRAIIQTTHRGASDLELLRDAEGIQRRTLRGLLRLLDSATCPRERAATHNAVHDATRAQAQAAGMLSAEIRHPGAYRRRLRRLFGDEGLQRSPGAYLSHLFGDEASRAAA